MQKNKAFGIVSSADNSIHVEGLHDYRPIGSFSFLGRFRVIDFPISNMSNSGMDRIQVYVRSRARSIAEHIGSGRHYNINSKRGKIQLLFAEDTNPHSIYNNDISAYMENIDIIERMHQDYVIIAPSFMVYKQDFKQLLDTHIESGADVTLLYHKVDNAKEYYQNCKTVSINRQKGILSIERNLGTAKEKNIFMETYCMSKEVFISLIKEARSLSSIYTLSDIVNLKCKDMDIRGVQHKGYFASLLSLSDYYRASIDLLDYDVASNLFRPEWPIYTRTTDSCPTQYFETSSVTNSFISNGCLLEGSVENSVIGRSVEIKKGATVKNSIIMAYAVIEEGVHIENAIVDKWAHIIHVKDISGTPEHPQYVKRRDTL
ncbi:glucose-1-phosphate adenylyltransferase subunit GlgD [Butyrivibrio sp. YAB3001]|uniref:glucose-1-phosphate adenylyltransferase subunit GlgD n=1 Tax=Butyrivibrio sp. YAB3001 TaxID=1520812 RepID=UPI0008F68EE4|nr:glucose-1-phosphate adenylyltransferase subunit GlgD [Butyrivibrio sp. YAB3001]SFB73906.1 glucose-1-phosphate adenylyltransferase [Butyrivibrio sp. YAB3001]